MMPAGAKDHHDTNTTISPMARDDISEVSELLRSSYAALSKLEGLTREQSDFLNTERGSIESLLSESQYQLFMLARDAGSIVGVVAVKGDMITKLYVSPERTGQGIGRSLYEAAESWVRAQGHSRVSLGAFPSAVPFYERMGLAVVGEKRPCGPLSGRTLFVMEKRLHRDAKG
jgi:predicted N-acetyltransferase YhbS